MPVEANRGDDNMAGPGERSATSRIVTVLGAISTRIDGQTHHLSPARRQLLALLVAAGPNGLAADHLAEELWAGEPPRQWESSLRMAISRLRHVLPEDALPAGDGRYRLALLSEEVDLWLLQQLAESDDNEINGLAQLDLLRATQPFNDIELAPLLQLATDRVRSYRLNLFDRLVNSGRPLNRLVNDELRAHAAADLLNEPLVLLSATADAQAGQPHRAQETLEACRRLLHDELEADLDHPLEALAQKLARDQTTEPVTSVTRSFPSILANQLDPPLVGREDLLAKLLANTPFGDTSPTRLLLLTGPSGVGKSRLAAVVAKHLYDQGADVRYGEAEPHSEITFGPLATLSEGVFNAVGQIMTEDSDPEIRAAAVWSRVLQSLEEDNGRPGIAVIDDAHWLDTQSRDLLLFLSRVPTRMNNGLIIIGSDDVDLAPWHELRMALGASDKVVTVEIPPYSSDDLLLLVNDRFGHRPVLARRNLAAELADLSGGNPAIAEAILNSVDQATMRPQNLSALDPEKTVVELVRSLSPAARQVGGVAAVLGRTFDLEHLSALTDLNMSSVLAALEELNQNRLIHELDTPNLFRFDNLLVQRAVETTMLDARRRQTHATAADLVSSIHQRASHMAAAVPVVPTAEAVAALCESAQLHLNEGNSNEAVQLVQTAERLSDEALPNDVQVAYASALDRSGAVAAAAEVRQRAFESATAENDWVGAVDAALSGLPAAERADGDPARVALLERIPLAQLDDDRGVTVALALARQNFLLDNVDAARRWGDYAGTRARTLADATLASTTKWLLSRHSLGANTGARWEAPGPLEEIPDNLRLSVLHPLVLEAVEFGEIETAKQHLASMGDLATERREPLGNWRWLLIRSTLDYLAGDFDSADAHSNQANELGFAYGIAEAPSSFTAQLWFRSWLLNQHGSLAPLFDLADEQLFRTDLARAARMSSRFAAGQTELALRETVDLLAQLKERGSAFGPAVPVILIELVCALDDPQHTDYLIESLEPWRGRMPIVANGIANLGPADYHLSKLVPADQRVELLRSSLELADRVGAPAWQIEARQSLAEITSNPELKADAAAMATGTIFEPLLK